MVPHEFHHNHYPHHHHGHHSFFTNYGTPLVNVYAPPPPYYGNYGNFFYRSPYVSAQPQVLVEIDPPCCTIL